MAKNMTFSTKTGRKRWMLLLLGCIPALSMAEQLTDPTQPPAELSARFGSTPKGNELKSIIISPTRRAAIINGQTVELGAKLGDVRLIEVSERGVVLEGTKGREVLTLFQNVKMDRKPDMPPMENDMEDSAPKKMPLDYQAGQQGRKEKK